MNGSLYGMYALAFMSLGIMAGCTGGPATGGAVPPKEIGTSTTALTSPSALELTGMQSAGARTLYVWGYTHRSHAFALFGSTDNGRTWINNTPSYPLSASSGSALWNQPYAVRFASARHGYIGWIGPERQAVTLAVTRDRGSHWHPVALTLPSGLSGGRVEAISTPSPTIALALVTGGFAAGHENRVLYITQDAGRHWQLRHGDTTGVDYASTGMSFLNDHVGFITIASQDSTPRVEVTSDGGRTWQTVALSTPITDRTTTAQTTAPTFYSPPLHSGYLTALYANSAVALYHTEDAGRTFAWQPTPTRFQAVSFATPTNGLALSTGRVLRTSDGGRVWQALWPGNTLRTALQNAPTITQLNYTPYGVGWLLLSSDNQTGTNNATVLLQSQDRGAHWQRVL